MVYQFREGSPFSGDAQKVGETLAAIEQREGRLDPSDVVTEARSIESPIHPYFEWDDAKAAGEYRLEQARGLVRAVVVVRVEEVERPPIRAFVSVKRDGERTYAPIDNVLTNPDLRAQAFAEIRGEICSLRRKLTAWEELARALELTDEIEQVVKQAELPI